MMATWRGTLGASGTAVVELEYFMNSKAKLVSPQWEQAASSGPSHLQM
jgi:hypothetical protein